MLLVGGGYPDGGFECKYGYELNTYVEEALELLGYKGQKVTLEYNLQNDIIVTVC